MATELGELIYTLTLNDSGFQGQLDTASNQVKESSDKMASSNEEVEESSGKAGGAFGDMAGQFVVGAALFTVGQKALSAVKGAIDGAITSAKDWQTQQAGLHAEIKATGDASGLSADQVTKMAEGIQNTTPISREAALAGDNMLLTFKGISGKAFPETAQAVADMATRMNGGLVPSAQQMSTTALQLGKALNDPATGVAKLTKEGVNFTKQQQETIKSMVAAGNTAGAQAFMLHELNSEFGGSAAANMKTYQGQVDAVKNKFNDFIGSIIDKLVPALQSVAMFFMTNRTALIALGVVVGTIAATLIVGLVGALVKTAAEFVTTGVKAEIAMAKTLAAAVKTAIQWGVSAARAVTSAAITSAAWIASAVASAAAWVTSAAITSAAWIASAVASAAAWVIANAAMLGGIGLIILIVVGAVVEIIKHWSSITSFFTTMWKDIKDMFTSAIQWISKNWQLLAAILLLPIAPLLLVWELFHKQIIGFFKDAVGVIQAIWNGIIGFFTAVWDTLVAIVKAYIAIYVAIFKVAYEAVIAVWNGIVGFFTGLINAVKAVFDGIKGFVVAIFRDEWNGIVDIFNGVAKYFSQVVGWVKSAFKDAASWLTDIGGQIIDGLVKGIENAAGKVFDAVKSVGSKAVSALKGVLKIFSPSQVFSDLGEFIPQGLAQGINNTASQAVSATKNVAQAVIGVGTSLPASVSTGVSNLSNNASSVIYQIQQVTLSSAEAVDEFFSIGNRNTQLEIGGGSPLAGTSGV
jgi:hypothetical protein